MLARMADLRERVTAKLAEMRPYLERSGGQVDLVEVEDGIAKLRVSLTRPGPSRLVASLQLKSGVERALRTDIPELRGVEAVNLPPYSELGWDQPDFRPTELPLPSDLTKSLADARDLKPSRGTKEHQRGGPG
jgi:Fe-S cluster biogenesis protein NfuA